MIGNILEVSFWTGFAPVPNFGEDFSTLSAVDLHLCWGFMEGPSVVHMKVSLAMDTGCDRRVKEPDSIKLYLNQIHPVKVKLL